MFLVRRLTAWTATDWSKLSACAGLLGLQKLRSTGCRIESDRQSNRYFKACRPKIRGADRTVVQTNRFRGNR
jgi:hypothetical protein